MLVTWLRNYTEDDKVSANPYVGIRELRWRRRVCTRLILVSGIFQRLCPHPQGPLASPDGPC